MTQVMVLEPDGPLVATEQDAVELLSRMFEQGADLVAVPVSRLPASFFTLRSGVAGAIVQKLVNYRRRLAVVGDIGSYVAGSSALRDFVVEANRGRDVWFVGSLSELDGRLGGLS